MGKVSTNNECLKMVCDFNPRASLAFQIGQHCFAVDCHDSESCSTINIEEKRESTTSIPTIIWYINSEHKNTPTPDKSKLGISLYS